MRWDPRRLRSNRVCPYVGWEILGSYAAPLLPPTRNDDGPDEFYTITLTDCCATTSAEGHKSATEGTFGMFSSPMTGEEFLKKINA